MTACVYDSGICVVQMHYHHQPPKADVYESFTPVAPAPVTAEAERLKSLRPVLAALNNEIMGFGSERGVILALFKWLAENGIHAEGEPPQFDLTKPPRRSWPSEMCLACLGTGQAPRSQIGVNSVPRPCPQCAGTGKHDGGAQRNG